MDRRRIYYPFYHEEDATPSPPPNGVANAVAPLNISRQDTQPITVSATSDVSNAPSTNTGNVGNGGANGPNAGSVPLEPLQNQERSAPNAEPAALAAQAAPAHQQVAASQQLSCAASRLVAQQQLAFLQETSLLTPSGFSLPGPPLHHLLARIFAPHLLTQFSLLFRGNSSAPPLPRVAPVDRALMESHKDHPIRNAESATIQEALVRSIQGEFPPTQSGGLIPGQPSQNPLFSTGLAHSLTPNPHMLQRSASGPNGNLPETIRTQIDREASAAALLHVAAVDKALVKPHESRPVPNAEPVAFQGAPLRQQQAAPNQSHLAQRKLTAHQQLATSRHGGLQPTQSGGPIPGPSSQNPLFSNGLPHSLTPNPHMLQGSASGPNGNLPGTPALPIIAQQTNDQSKTIAKLQKTVDRLRSERNRWREDSRVSGENVKKSEEVRLQAEQGSAVLSGRIKMMTYDYHESIRQKDEVISTQQEEIKIKNIQIALLSQFMTAEQIAQVEAALKKEMEEEKKEKKTAMANARRQAKIQEMREEAAEYLRMQENVRNSVGETSEPRESNCGGVAAEEREEMDGGKASRKRKSNDPSRGEKKKKAREPNDSE